MLTFTSGIGVISVGPTKGQPRIHSDYKTNSPFKNHKSSYSKFSLPPSTAKAAPGIPQTGTHRKFASVPGCHLVFSVPHSPGSEPGLGATPVTPFLHSIPVPSWKVLAVRAGKAPENRAGGD